MPSMSYCAFENTTSELSQIEGMLQRALDDGKTMVQFREGLSSRYEKNAFDHFYNKLESVKELLEQLAEDEDREEDEEE